jgi:hypothetical protein
MVSVAIVGLLSTVAFPGYHQMTLRTRKSERDVVMRSIERSIGSVLIRDGRLEMPLNSDGSGKADFTGAWNPDNVPGTHKRPMLVAPADAWKHLDLIVEGGVFHSYMFTPLNDSSTALTITAIGDLDGDGQQQRKVASFLIEDGGLSPDRVKPIEFVPQGDFLF